MLVARKRAARPELNVKFQSNPMVVSSLVARIDSESRYWLHFAVRFGRIHGDSLPGTKGAVSASVRTNCG